MGILANPARPTWADSLLSLTVPSRALALDPAQHQAVDDLATADDEDDEHRYAGDDRHSQHLRIVRGIERAELREAKRNRFHLVTLNNDQRPKQVIPTLQERENPERGECWPRQWQDHREEDSQLPGAIDPGCIDELARDRLDELAHHEDGESGESTGNDQAPVGVDPAEVSDQHEERDHDHGEGNHEHNQDQPELKFTAGTG